MMERDIIAFRRAPPCRRLLVHPHPLAIRLFHPSNPLGVACIPQTGVLIMWTDSTIRLC